MSSRITYNSRRNKVKKTIKDYLIPIVGIFIIIIILYSVFSGGDDNTTTTKSSTGITNSKVVVKLDDAESEAYIMSEKEDKKLISGEANLEPTQKLVVKEGTTTIEYNGVGTFKLNKMGELELDKNSQFKLISSDLWIDAKKGFTIDTIYTKVKISAGSIISLNQNEALSTVYVISGSAEVSNLAGKKTLLGNLQKLTISNQDASNKDVDLALSKDNVDDFFKNSVWYVKNNGDSFLSGSLLSSSGSTGSTVSTGTLSTSAIELDDLRDEIVLDTSKVALSGKYYNDFVSSITLDGVKAKLNTELKTFSFGTVTLTKKENDLVFKLYDTDGNVISKVVYTLYYNGPIIQETTSSTTTADTTGTSVKNYQVDGSKFIFTEPGSTPYTTTESFVTIRGQVPAGIVTKVIVNGFTLGSFNGTTWRYHAAVDNDNLKDGTNVYEVKYYGEGGKLIYSNSYVIIKKTKLVETNGGATVTE
ncbi:MAG: hypothetical protein WC850_02320 [Candidatus Gracilibacteria bacterium]